MIPKWNEEAKQGTPHVWGAFQTRLTEKCKGSEIETTTIWLIVWGANEKLEE